MHIAVEHVVLLLPLHIVPSASLLVLLAIGGPVPVSLDDFV